MARGEAAARTQGPAAHPHSQETATPTDAHEPDSAGPDSHAHGGGLDTRALLGALDGQIISMVLCRAEIACREQLARRLSGLPASELAWENGVLERYARQLGRSGADIGRAVLSLSMLPLPVPTGGPDEGKDMKN